MFQESPQSRRQSGKFTNLPSPLVSPIHNDWNNVLCKRDSIINMSIDLEKSQKFDNDDNNDDLLGKISLLYPCHTKLFLV